MTVLDRVSAQPRGLICKLTILYTFDPLCLIFSDWKRYPVLDHIRKVIFALCVRDFCYILLRGIRAEGGNAVYQCPEGISLCNGGVRQLCRVRLAWMLTRLLGGDGTVIGAGDEQGVEEVRSVPHLRSCRC